MTDLLVVTLDRFTTPVRLLSKFIFKQLKLI